MRLAIQPDGAVVVTVPHFFGLGSVERFVARHSEWIHRTVEKTKRRIVVRLKKSEVPLLKKRALSLAHERCEYFAGLYGFTYRKISVRAQKTRWGSCSRNGNLSFNYRIAALPPRIADYIVVHELCHLGEMNHSKRFWALVAKTVPEYAAIRKELRNTAFMYA